MNTVTYPTPPKPAGAHPRVLRWGGTTALALGGSNQSLFLIGALIAGQNHIPGQGSAAVLLLILGLILAWMAAPGWTELVLLYPDRVGGIASCCAEAFRPYSPVLANLTGTCYWWGWIPTCGLTALLSASAIHQWYLPGVPIPGLAVGLVLFFTGLNLAGIRRVTGLMTPVAVASASLAFLSALTPMLTGHVDWRRATDLHLTVPFPGPFGTLTAGMAGLYLIGFAAPAFEAAACHVGETADPARNVPRAMLASGAMASAYFALLPVVWLGVLGPERLSGDLASVLGPTFAPVFGSAAKAAAIWFMMLNMFHGTVQPLAGAARALYQLAEDGLLPRLLARRSATDAPWVATLLTTAMATAFLLAGDPIWMVAAANLTYLIGICLPNVAVWLLRRDAPERPRPYRAPRGTIELGLAAASVWGVSALFGFEQFGLPTVLFGLALAYSGAALYALRRWSDRRRSRMPMRRGSLHVKLTGAMLLVLALDGTGYLMAIRHVSRHEPALTTALADIFVAVALLTISVGLVLPGVIAHAAEQVAAAADRLARGTLADFSRAMRALGEGDLEAARARVEVVPVVVHARDELGAMATSFNLMQQEIAQAALGLDEAREGLRQAHEDLINANATLERRVEERTLAWQVANETLRVSEERFRSLVQNASDIITVVDPAAVIWYQGPSVQQVLQHAPEELVGTSVFTLVHPEDLPFAQAVLADLLVHPGESRALEVRVRHADGSWRLFEAIATNLRDDPSVRGIVINSRDVTERRALEQERERLLVEAQARADRETLINRIGVALRTSLNPDAVQAVALEELGAALGADRCFLSVRDADTEERSIVQEWRRPGLPPLVGRYQAAGADSAEGLRQTVVIRDVSDIGGDVDGDTRTWLTRLGLRSAVKVLLVEQNAILAVLTVAMTEAPRAWTDEEVSLIEAVAAQTRAAVETARYHQREHLIAESLQQALLPPIPDNIPGLDVQRHYRAALAEARVGGDFYDVFSLGRGVYALVIGDVSGKGLAAAAQVATIRHMLRSTLYLGLTVAEAVTQLNALVIEQDLLTGFATLFVGALDITSGVLSYVNCGHEPGLVRRADTLQVEELSAGGMALGIHEAERYSQSLVALTPGDALVLYTDGLSEAASAKRELLGVPGVQRLIRDCPEAGHASSLITHLIAGADTHTGRQWRDDVCVLAAVFDPAPAARSEPMHLPVEVDSWALGRPHTFPPPAGTMSGEANRDALAELSQDLIATVRDGRVSAINAAGCRLLGAGGAEEILGRRLLDLIQPQHRPLVQARLRLVAQGEPIHGMEQQWSRVDGAPLSLDVSASETTFPDGAGLLVVGRDVMDRRQIEEENVRLLCQLNAASARQRAFLRDVFGSVTEGRLRLCETEEDLPARPARFGSRLPLSTEDVRRIRSVARQAAEAADLPSDHAMDLISAVGEAAMNAVAHGGGGWGEVFVDPAGTVQVWIQDQGAGIAFDHLPQATLERGYTTAGTLGHGFWIMLQMVDRLWLLTGAEGTTVVLEQDRARPEPKWHGLRDAESSLVAVS